MRAGHLLLTGLISLPFTALAGPSDYFNVYNVPDGELGEYTDEWTPGSADLTFTATFCIASANYNNSYSSSSPPASGAEQQPYKIKVDSRYSNQSNFYVYKNDVSTATDNRRIPVTVEHRDTMDGNAWHQLSYDTYESMDLHDGQWKNCNFGDNSQLRFTFDGDDLDNARAGNYRGKWRIDGMGGSSGTKTDGDNFRTKFSVPDIVRVSGLSDMDLGNVSTTADQTIESEFCIYANSSSGTYQVTFTSPNKDVNGNYYLTGTGGTINYDLYFKANTTAGFGTQVGNSALTGNGNNSSSSCSGANNAKLSVSILSGKMSGAEGSYSDTLTLVVAPQ